MYIHKYTSNLVLILDYNHINLYFLNKVNIEYYCKLLVKFYLNCYNVFWGGSVYEK